MPCNGGGGTQYVDNTAERTVDLLTQHLCTLCQALEKAGQAKLMAPEVAAWWGAHKMADLDRLEREKKQAEATRQSKLAIFNQLRKELWPDRK